MELPKRKPARLKGYDYFEAAHISLRLPRTKKRSTLGKIVVGQGLARAAQLKPAISRVGQGLAPAASNV